MKIDAHQHFWKFDATEYFWIADQMNALKRDFLPGDLLPELQGTGFDGSVAVQARQCLEETRWLLDLADKNDFIKGVVGWIDLCSEKSEEQVKKFADHSKFSGVRHVLHDEPDDRFMLKDSFLSGIKMLGRYNLVYDILIFPRHLSYASELVSLFPQQKFVLDHLAKPFIRDGILSPWADRIEQLAKHPNVSCKLSGMVTEAIWHGWSKEDFKPYLDVIFDSFGPSRLMIGSDWPVCTLSSGYNSTMNIVIDYIHSLTTNEQDMILGRNAIRIYNLKIPYQI